jgi:RNA polymerase sigma factor (sigma-70 family)
MVMGLRALTGLLLRLRGAGKDSDADLLRRFVADRDQGAFAQLVRRHGTMVLQVCQRVLGHVQDAEDAYQATFMVLARKAASLSEPDSLGGWLHGVAYRTALNARKLRGKRQRAQSSNGIDLVARERDGSSELREVLDAELARLPEKYRVLLVLCALEGRSLDEVASKLRRPVGTVKRELFEARGLLRQRLVRRGLSSAPLALAALLEPSTASAGGVTVGLHAAVIHGLDWGYSADVVALANVTMAGAASRGWKLIAALMILGSVSVSAAVLTWHQPTISSEHADRYLARHRIGDVEDIKYLGFIPPMSSMTINGVSLAQVHTYSAKMYVDDGSGSIKLVTDYCIYGSLSGDAVSTQPDFEAVRVDFRKLALMISERNCTRSATSASAPPGSSAGR